VSSQPQPAAPLGSKYYDTVEITVEIIPVPPRIGGQPKLFESIINRYIR